MSAHKDKKEQDMKRSRLDDITRKVKEGEGRRAGECLVMLRAQEYTLSTFCL